MGLVNRIIAACLRAATRRWPADVRDDMAQEWAAELSALERQGGTGWQRLAFALSLATTPLIIDEGGAPRGRWEWMRAGATLRTVSRLLVAGAFGVGITMAMRSVVGGLLPEQAIGDVNQWMLASIVTTALMTAYAVVVGRWAGSRGAPQAGPAGSLGVAATVVLPLAPLFPFVLAMLTEMTLVLCLVTTVCWAAATGALAAREVRAASVGRPARAWSWVAAGAVGPLAAAPSSVTLLLQDLPGLHSYLFTNIVNVTFLLLPWSVCAIAFGRSTVRLWSTPAVHDRPEPEPEAETDTALTPAEPIRWWRVTVERVVLVSLAATSAVVWALGVTVLQPLSEPTGPDAYGENNTYWARELRWGALIAGILVLLVYVRGDRRATRGVLLGGGAWLAADICLDRIDPTSGTVGLAICAAVVAVLACAVAGDVPVVPRPQALLTVATVAAIMSVMATQNESPTDTEPALNLGSAAVGSLLAAVAVVAAVRAAGSVSVLRAVVAAPIGVALAAAPWALRHRYPQPNDARYYGGFVLAALLLLAVVVLAGPRPRTWQHWLRYPAALAVGAVTLPVMMMPLMYMFIILPFGNVFTALADNPPINSADSDIVMIFIAVPIGLVLGRLLRGLTFGRPSRPPAPRPAAARVNPRLAQPDPG
ncbi:hypothetical protein [Actinoplanes regularis]|uniref:hypothetical protein n=1 Tax=Actinoplanes regularis TaxID=52697 RepID=UPI00249FBE1E|nr:hypothetical protein [Actinoplanes regularis]GLW33725.1 hypothetical protein Areg01_66630 [Actinoplanes regularis]